MQIKKFIHTAVTAKRIDLNSEWWLTDYAHARVHTLDDINNYEMLTLTVRNKEILRFVGGQRRLLENADKR